MSPLSKKLLIGLVSAGLALAAEAYADTANTTTTGMSARTPVITVRQEIAQFADRYGKPVIVHGAINMDAPVSINYKEGLSSDQAIVAVSQAAGAYAQRVYFVSPASATNSTLGSSATRLVGNRGSVTLNLRHVTAQAAIAAVAAADDAEVRFPNGVPSGAVTFKTAGMPLDNAIARIATLTHTRWTLGYLLESTNPSLPSLAQQQSEQASTETNGSNSASPTSVPSDWPTGKVVANLPPLPPLPRDAAGNILPFTVHTYKTIAPPPTITSSMTPAQVAAAQQQAAAYNAQQAQLQQQYAFGINSANQPSSEYAPNVQTFPGDDLFGGPTQANQNYLGGNFGTVQTIIPSGSQSGFQILPYGYGF